MVEWILSRTRTPVLPAKGWDPESGIPVSVVHPVSSFSGVGKNRLGTTVTLRELVV